MVIKSFFFVDGVFVCGLPLDWLLLNSLISWATRRTTKREEKRFLFRCFCIFWLLGLSFNLEIPCSYIFFHGIWILFFFSYPFSRLNLREFCVFFAVWSWTPRSSMEGFPFPNSSISITDYVSSNKEFHCFASILCGIVLCSIVSWVLSWIHFCIIIPLNWLLFGYILLNALLLKPRIIICVLNLVFPILQFPLLCAYKWVFFF